MFPDKIKNPKNPPSGQDEYTCSVMVTLRRYSTKIIKCKRECDQFTLDNFGEHFRIEGNLSKTAFSPSSDQKWLEWQYLFCCTHDSLLLTSRDV